MRTELVPPAEWYVKMVAIVEGVDLTDPEEADRVAAADPGVDSARLDTIARRGDHRVQYTAARNPSASPETLEYLLNMGRGFAVADNPGAPPEVLSEAWRRFVHAPDEFSTPDERPLYNEMCEVVIANPATPMKTVLAALRNPSVAGTYLVDVAQSGRAVEIASAVTEHRPLTELEQLWWVDGQADPKLILDAGGNRAVEVAARLAAADPMTLRELYEARSDMSARLALAGNTSLPADIHEALVIEGSTSPTILGIVALANTAFPRARWTAPIDLVFSADLGSTWLPPLDPVVAECVLGLAPQWEHGLEALIDTAELLTSPSAAAV